jgi:zinc knuckle protein
MRCFECGDDGHIARECPNLGITSADGKPPWCGSCDETTRLVDLGDKMKRCTACHPLRGRMLAQDRRCPVCRQIVYVWDHSACDNHQEVGIHRDFVGWKRAKPARSEEDLRALAAQQVTESRADHEKIDAWLAASTPG